VLRTIAQGVLVLKAPSKDDLGGRSSSSREESVILRLGDAQAARLAYASDNGTIWFALRPPAGVQQSDPTTVTAQSVAGPKVDSLPASEASRPNR
jgi:Flp pilus assembly protein CpaB